MHSLLNLLRLPPPQRAHSLKLPVTPWKPCRGCLKNHFVTREWRLYEKSRAVTAFVRTPRSGSPAGVGTCRTPDRQPPTRTNRRPTRDRTQSFVHERSPTQSHAQLLRRELLLISHTTRIASRQHVTRRSSSALPRCFDPRHFHRVEEARAAAQNNMECGGAPPLSRSTTRHGRPRRGMPRLTRKREHTSALQVNAPNSQWSR